MWLADLWSVLVSYVDAYGNTTPTNQRKSIRFLGAGVTVTDNPAKQSTDIAIPGSQVPTVPLAGSEVALGPAGQWVLGPVYTGTSAATASAATTATLATATVAPASSLDVRLRLKGRIDLLPGVSVSVTLAHTAGTVRPATGSADGLMGNANAVDTLSTVAPFAGVTAGATLSGNVVTISATLGVVSAWAIATAYAAGPFGTARHVVTNDGGKIYVCTAPGTSAGSGGPTGTGSGITDGGATWAYVGTSITCNWTLALETFVG